jgi:hypothetical protein
MAAFGALNLRRVVGHSSRSEIVALRHSECPQSRGGAGYELGSADGER